MVKKAKKRGRKPGVKVGPYKKRGVSSIEDIQAATEALKVLIRNRIKHLNKLLKGIK